MGYLKLNLLILFLEVYTITTLLFDFALPGSTLFSESSTNKLLVSFLPLILTFISKYTEGWSTITIPTLLCTLLIPIGSVMEGPLKLGLAVVVALIAISHINAIRYFPVKSPVKSTGKFQVGYRDYKVQGDVIYSVFYPTLIPTFKYPRFLPDADAWRKYFELVQGDSKFPPKWLFELVTHILTKVKILAHVNAEIVSKENLEQHNLTKLVPIIFSHGLCANRHNYASLLCQLASQGFFIISVDHLDEVREIVLDIEKKAPVYLDRRVKEIGKLIDGLQDKSGSVYKMFGSDLELDMSRLTTMGHSYGGTSAYKIASEDERVKNIVLLDPWFGPLPKESLDKKLGCSVMLFESWDWNDRHPSFGITERNLSVMEAHSKSERGAIYCKVPNSQHNNFSDDMLYVGGIIKALKIINDIDASEANYKGNIKAISDYCSIIIDKGLTSDDLLSMYKDCSAYPLKKFA